MHKTIIGAALGAIPLAGCGGQEAPESEAPKPTTAPTRAKAPAPTVASRCLDVPAALLNSIEDGLTTNGPGSLRHGQAVKSTVTFESPGRPPQAVYMVAADIQAAGMDPTRSACGRSPAASPTRAWSSAPTASPKSSRTGRRTIRGWSSTLPTMASTRPASASASAGDDLAP